MVDLAPYLTSPFYVSMGLTIIIILILPILIKFIRPDMWNNFFHIPYWKVYILNGVDVLKTKIVRKDLKQSRVKTITDKPYTWIIVDDSWIDFKSSSMIFLDVKSCMSIKLFSEDEQNLFKEMQEEKDVKKVISKIPIINRFAISKRIYDDKEKMVGFSKKIKTNPEFIINAVTFHIFLKQKFTDDIIKVPKTLFEILEENMTLIIIVVFIFLMYLVFNKTL